MPSEPKLSMTWPQFLRGCCSFAGAEVKLEPKQAEVLLALLMSKPQFLTRSELVEAMYPNPDLEPDGAEQFARKSICLMRKKLCHDIVESWWNYGYRISPRYW